MVCKWGRMIISLSLSAPRSWWHGSKPLPAVGQMCSYLRPRQKMLRSFGDFNIDLLKHKISYKGQEVKLTSIEFDIVEFLSRSPGRVWSREQILDNVWKEGKFIIDRAVDVHVRGLRKKLGKAENYIETVRGVGYRFKDVE